jgi:hypothetical protein
MSWWALLTLIMGTWLLWAVGLLIGNRLAIRAGRRPPNAGVSLAPIIPVFPLFFFGLAVLINWFASPWGTWLVGGFHAMLSVIFLVAIGVAMCRAHRADPAA